MSKHAIIDRTSQLRKTRVSSVKKIANHSPIQNAGRTRSLSQRNARIRIVNSDKSRSSRSYVMPILIHTIRCRSVPNAMSQHVRNVEGNPTTRLQINEAPNMSKHAIIDCTSQIRKTRVSSVIKIADSRPIQNASRTRSLSQRNPRRWNTNLNKSRSRISHVLTKLIHTPSRSSVKNALRQHMSDVISNPTARSQINKTANGPKHVIIDRTSQIRKTRVSSVIQKAHRRSAYNIVCTRSLSQRNPRRWNTNLNKSRSRISHVLTKLIHTPSRSSVKNALRQHMSDVISNPTARSQINKTANGPKHVIIDRTSQIRKTRVSSVIQKAHRRSAYNIVCTRSLSQRNPRVRRCDYAFNERACFVNCK